MWKKISAYFIVAILAFILGAASTGNLFAEKEDEAGQKKYDIIIKKLESIEKSQNEMMELLKFIKYRGK
ncbi:MAG: hypothetical protein JW928_01665 [Candidatus Aureabacteria bacterium]|nr:hypothetical protein [Candidatus Auribacterota bacterium]